MGKGTENREFMAHSDWPRQRGAGIWVKDRRDSCHFQGRKQAGAQPADGELGLGSRPLYPVPAPPISGSRGTLQKILWVQTVPSNLSFAPTRLRDLRQLLISLSRNIFVIRGKARPLTPISWTGMKLMCRIKSDNALCGE